MNYILETERLGLRHFDLEDTVFIIKLLNTPDWISFIGDKNVKTEAQAKDYLSKGALKSYQENGFGLYLVMLKDSKTPIGMCGLVKRDFLAHPDIGFAFLPDFFGRGYAYEACSALMNYSKEHLKIQTIYAITLEENVRSIHLLQKIGMCYAQKLKANKDGEELLLFST